MSDTLVKAKERPILFSGPMVRAILEERKTQTRRPIKRDLADWLEDGGNREIETDQGIFNILRFCPFGQPGDRLWVRETWAESGFKRIEYKAFPADGSDFRCVNNWRPSIHMPRWASRITLEITNVRAERIRDIDDLGIRAEGYEGDFCNSRFSDSWNSFYPGSWDRNDWVWVVEFKKI